MKLPTTEPLFAGDTVDVDTLNGHKRWHAPRYIELPAEAQEARERFSPLGYSADGAVYDENKNRAQKPSYRFEGEAPPAALEHVRDKPCWLGWKYEERNGRSTKPPFNPRTGRHASVSDQATWATFDAALAGMEKHGFAGLGLVLTDDGDITGIDLDHCISDSGSFSNLAAEIISYGETYAEESPSGKGVRLFARGKITQAIKNDALGIEVYGTGRYLTVTGRHIPDTPNEIREAPRTLARLSAVVEAARPASRPNGNGKAQASADFFGNVNALALARLDNWVPQLHPTAHKSPNGAWRITSHDLGRGLEEDLSYHADGIRDHGEEHGLTPIDAVQRYGDAADAKAAAIWLCRRLGIEPASLGWNGNQRRNPDKQRADTEAVDAGTSTGDKQRNDGKRTTQAERLIEIATGDGVELFHSPDGTTYADITVNGHRETWPTKSSGFKGWLRRTYYEQTGGAPNSDAMSTAMGVIEARARFDGVERTVCLRVAEHGNKLYLDLCNDDWSAVEIDANGWRIVNRPQVRFRRTPGMLPLPYPESGASLDELRKHLHVDNSGYVLAVSWLLASLRRRGPYPILALTGEQGTGKSLTAHQLRSLIDPHTASLRSLPRDTRDLYVIAMNGHVLVFDNLSSMSAEISDCLCRLSTGGGFSTRALYTDNDEVIFDGQRPIALTSITDVASRSDLADRLVLVRLEMIPDDERRPEQELRTAFEAARPRILGALLDVVSHGLMQLPSTRLNRHPRMADYAVWVRACETAIWSAGMHMAAYEENRADAVEIVLDADPVAMALRQHMQGRPETTTTATELLAALGALVHDQVRRGRQWPSSARVLSGQLTRLGPALRRAGFRIEHRRQGHTGARLIHIRREGSS